MNKQLFILAIISFFGIVLISLIGCSSAVELTSDLKTKEILIDGKADDWEVGMYDLDKANLTIGVRNDTENLYLCLISFDQNIKRQIMEGGFTVWFDPQGGTDEKYGIKFPVGRPKGGRPMGKSGNSNDDDYPDSSRSGDNTPPPMPGNIDSMLSRQDFGNIENKMPLMSNNILREIQFLGPEENDIRQLTTYELKTISVQIGITKKAFIYEIKVPLYKTVDFPFKLLPTNKKNILGIEFKTENLFAGRMGMPGGGPGGGGPPPGGGPGGGRFGGGPPDGGRGGRSRGSDSMSEPLELWIKVVLANNPNTSVLK